MTKGLHRAKFCPVIELVVLYHNAVKNVFLVHTKMRMYKFMYALMRVGLMLSRVRFSKEVESMTAFA